MQMIKKGKCLHFLFILRSLIMNTNFKLVKYTHTHTNGNELPNNVTILLTKNVKVEFDFKEKYDVLKDVKQLRFF